mmetsp:Transcript_12897/g.19887  ORF Transcript_12897/g.19887 Transcript_12897/m.19887 type:complete len:248 (-) Transcript_12897:54-797(-)
MALLDICLQDNPIAARRSLLTAIASSTLPQRRSRTKMPTPMDKKILNIRSEVKMNIPSRRRMRAIDIAARVTIHKAWHSCGYVITLQSDSPIHVFLDDRSFISATSLFSSFSNSCQGTRFITRKTESAATMTTTATVDMPGGHPTVTKPVMHTDKTALIDNPITQNSHTEGEVSATITGTAVDRIGNRNVAASNHSRLLSFDTNQITVPRINVVQIDAHIPSRDIGDVFAEVSSDQMRVDNITNPMS